MSLRHFAFGLGTALLLGGCSFFVEKPVPGFGDSVRHMVQQQTFDPSAPQSATEPGGGLDGDKAAGAVKTYREPKKASAGGQTTVLTPSSQ